MGPAFMEGFASWLNGVVPLPVGIARDGERAEGGRVYVAPGDRHLELGENRILRILDSAPVGGQRPAATVLFRSVARQAGSRGIGVLLTGMGEDGALGLLDMRKAGAATIAEHESTAVVYGMPAAAVRLAAARCVAAPRPDRGPVLRRVDSEPRAVSGAQAGAGRGRAARLLLVEDSETQALELRLFLEAQGFAVERCPTAESALDHLNRTCPTSWWPITTSPA